ncbi:hypothetical protein DM860_007489 [Cuscuta australis]|uniref:X8 domain-containing protein n=1 Tax=Cuscuta australis TaxID=267555 RepID=A0A328E8A9_9ASTE|nr:hypothetical protein DM860_007489 [Cuscuta australis]
MAAMASFFIIFIFFFRCLLLSCSSSDPLIPAVVTVPAATTTTPFPFQNPNNAGPITNPVTTPPASTNPPLSPAVSAPPAATNPTGGQTWCVARPGLPDSSLQPALDYACGQVDCKEIQQNGRCFNPSTVQSHASFAFNAYYQKNPSPGSCDFGGTATITTVNPSFDSCVYLTTSGSTSSPSPVPQMPPPPTTSSVPVPVPIPTPTTAVPTPIMSPTTTTSSPLPGGVPGTGTFPPVFPNMTNPTIPIITPTGQIPGISPASTSTSTLLQPVLGPVFLMVSSICFGTLILKV